MELKAGEGVWQGGPCEGRGQVRRWGHIHTVTWTPEVTRKVASLAVMLS